MPKYDDILYLGESGENNWKHIVLEIGEKWFNCYKEGLVKNFKDPEKFDLTHIVDDDVNDRLRILPEKDSEWRKLAAVRYRGLVRGVLIDKLIKGD